MRSCSGESSPSGICSASWLWASKSLCPLPRLYGWDSCWTRCKTTCLQRRRKAAQRCRAWVPRLELVALCRGCRASLQTIWKSTAASTTTHTWCAWSRGCWWVSLTESKMTASVFSSPREEAPKMVVSVRWCWCCWPVASVLYSKPAPQAAWVRIVVPEESAKMTVLWSSRHGRRRGVVGW